MSRWWLLLPLAIVIEFWIYGARGHVQVCVGKAEHTDFSLVGAERNDDNRWKVPRCESRLNLGLTSDFEPKVQEATAVACRGATLFRFPGETTACKELSQGWERRLNTEQCWPWHRHFIEQLLWFAMK